MQHIQGYLKIAGYIFIKIGLINIEIKLGIFLICRSVNYDIIFSNASLTECNN